MRVKSASCAPTAADRAHEYPHQILSMRSPAAVESTIEKDFFFFFAIVAICIILFIVSSKHTIDIHTTETKRREVMEAEDAAEDGWLAVWPTHNGTTEMSQGNQACDGSSTVVARSTR